MSNSINMRHRRKIITHTFKGRTSRGDCARPSLGASKADLAEFHAERLKLRRARQLGRTATVRLVPRGSIATGNRHIVRIAAPHDLAPHEHKREIARHLRQQARTA